MRKEEEKEAFVNLKKEKEADGKKAKGGAGAGDEDTVFDARWAKSLKPSDLKKELKRRELSTQGSKKELLTRLIGDVQAKST